MHSPKIERIEIAARGDVRRAKLYYLRERVGKRARVRERRAVGAEEAVEAGLLYAPEEEEPPVEEGEMPVDDELAAELASERALTLLCGRYEGFDERIVEHLATDAVSIGRYVLAGGELAAMVLCDAVIRKLPGALGDATSAVEESFSPALEGAPEYPHYTRPAEYRGWSVPEVLLSGHHGRIREWRLEQARRRGSGQADPLR